MDTSNLHAEQRVDRRGNVVTRWVRSFSKPKAAAPVRPPAGMAVSDVPTLTANANKVNSLKTQSTEVYEQNRVLIAKAGDKKDYDMLRAYQKYLKAFSAAEIHYVMRALRSMGYEKASLKIDERYLSAGASVAKAIVDSRAPVPPREMLRVMTVAFESLSDTEFIVDAIRARTYPFHETLAPV